MHVLHILEQLCTFSGTATCYKHQFRQYSTPCITTCCSMHSHTAACIVLHEYCDSIGEFYSLTPLARVRLIAQTTLSVQCKGFLASSRFPEARVNWALAYRKIFRFQVGQCDRSFRFSVHSESQSKCTLTSPHLAYWASIATSSVSIQVHGYKYREHVSCNVKYTSLIINQSMILATPILTW